MSPHPIFFYPEFCTELFMKATRFSLGYDLFCNKSAPVHSHELLRQKRLCYIQSKFLNRKYAIATFLPRILSKWHKISQAEGPLLQIWVCIQRKAWAANASHTCKTSRWLELARSGWILESILNVFASRIHASSPFSSHFSLTMLCTPFSYILYQCFPCSKNAWKISFSCTSIIANVFLIYCATFCMLLKSCFELQYSILAESLQQAGKQCLQSFKNFLTELVQAFKKPENVTLNTRQTYFKAN